MPKANSTPSFEIDADNLDREWINQPDLFYKYASASAEMKLVLAEVQQELDVVSAELDQDIRERPAKYGMDKMTEAAIKATIPLQSKYKECQKRVNKARYDVDILQAAVTACDHRKKALENLVNLHGQQYFSTPRASSDGAEAMRSSTKKSVHARQKMSRQELEEDS